MRREHTNSRACRASHRSARAQRRAAALDRIEQGDRPDDVATQIGVSRRTLDRWRADARTSA
ncbi:helix-turn-helix domain-containing protein [Pseudonocardia carboxydivorans]|uniref:Helix-turn-helix domain-containing protein n=1 Tax=Pseudonocardia alni subsp. carboxydivorans TaxID=415010 RepID=A0ABU9AL57_PSEA5|nr:helix-turn-helix domain-containing protein [Pseudonocardia sp. ICBG1034]